jgi:hypothetical protein
MYWLLGRCAGTCFGADAPTSGARVAFVCTDGTRHGLFGQIVVDLGAYPQYRIHPDLPVTTQPRGDIHKVAAVAGKLSQRGDEGRMREDINETTFPRGYPRQSVRD